MKHLILLAFILPFIGVSCSSVTKTHSDGTVVEVRAFGGKGAFKDNAADGLMYVYNNEKSFYHGSVVVGAAVTAAGSAYATAAAASVDKATIAADKAKHAATQQTVINAQNVGGEVMKNADNARKALEMSPMGATPKLY